MLTWMAQGICSQSPEPDDWHADRNEDRVAYYRAKAACRDCPVRLVCLEFAQATREPEGIWGGLDPEERFELRQNVLRQLTRRRVLAL
jgi:WhiB family transcriptional regulator, redox-sensing transcriptional regulator